MPDPIITSPPPVLTLPGPEIEAPPVPEAPTFEITAAPLPVVPSWAQAAPVPPVPDVPTWAMGSDVPPPSFEPVPLDIVAPPPVPTLLGPDTVDPSIEPAPEEIVIDTPPEVPLGAGSATEQHRATGEQLSTLEGQRDRLGARMAEIRAEHATSTNPEVKASLVERYETLAQASGEVESEIDAQRRRFEETQAQAEQTIAANARQAQADGLTAATEQARDLRAKADTEIATVRQDRDNAQARLQQDREAYQRVLSAGPKRSESWGALAANATAEAIRAAFERRPANIAGIVDRYIERLDREAQTEWQAQTQAALARVGGAEDDITTLAQREREIEADTAAKRAAIFLELDQDLAVKLEQAGATAQGAALSGGLSQIRQAREIADAQAQQKARDAAAGQRKQAAEIRKLDAEARRAEAQAAIDERKARGGGSGRAKPGAAGFGTLSPFDVTIPGAVDADGNPVKLATFGTDSDGDGKITPAERQEASKRAQAANGWVADAYSAMTQINQIERKYRDFERDGLPSLGGWGASAEKIDLEGDVKFMEPGLARLKAGAGLATTNADDSWAAGMVGDPTAWLANRKTSETKIATLRKNLEKTLRENAARAGLPPEAAEKLIRESRRGGVEASKKERARREAGQAQEILASDEAPPERKVPAVTNLVAEAQREADDRGDKDDWIYLAAPRLERALDKAQDPETRAALADELRRLSGLAQGRAQQSLSRLQGSAMARAGQGPRDEATAEYQRATEFVNRVDTTLGGAQLDALSPTIGDAARLIRRARRGDE